MDYIILEKNIIRYYNLKLGSYYNNTLVTTLLEALVSIIIKRLRL